MAYRIEKVNNLLRNEISELLRRQIKDPRLSSMITVTEVVTSPDLRYAKVYVSHIGDAEERKETLNGLVAASKFIRSELAKRLRLRRIPELGFYWDSSIEHGAHILELIDKVIPSSPDNE